MFRCLTSASRPRVPFAPGFRACSLATAPAMTAACGDLLGPDRTVTPQSAPSRSAAGSRSYGAVLQARVVAP